MAKKSKKTKKQVEHQASNIRPDLQQIIRAAFPYDIVELPCEWEEGELDELYAVVRAKLVGLPNSRLLYEQPDDDNWPNAGPR